MIIDACTRQVLAYACSLSLEEDFVLTTLNRLIEKHGETLNVNEKTLFHSDQGSHYTCNKLIDLVNDSGLRQSMSRKGNCWDNAPQESFFGHMKDEVKIKGRSVGEICAKIDDWMDYYNNERYVWDLHKLSPNEYYEWVLNGICHQIKLQLLKKKVQYRCKICKEIHYCIIFLIPKYQISP